MEFGKDKYLVYFFQNCRCLLGLVLHLLFSHLVLVHEVVLGYYAIYCKRQKIRYTCTRVHSSSSLCMGF